MNSIKGFLKKFLDLERFNNAKLSEILEIIREETNIELKKEMLEIKGNNLRIKCDPVFRNEIFMHLPKIESKLKSQKIFLKLI